MKKASTHTPVSIRFRRWSRKAYSVFASLGKSISIGNLSVQMAGESLFRKVELIKLVLTIEQVNEEDDEEQLSLLLSENIVIATIANKVSGVFPAAYNKHIY